MISSILGTIAALAFVVGSVSADNLTADDQKLTDLDTKITAEIRKEIVNKDGMSTNGKNIKIISRDGVVTLNGEVADLNERNWIDAQAKRQPSVRSVTNNLKIK